jgi:hypothetical protein
MLALIATMVTASILGMGMTPTTAYVIAAAALLTSRIKPHSSIEGEMPGIFGQLSQYGD